MLGLVERSLQKLLPLISRRFRSFSEATDAALDVLASELPGEIVLGQIEPGEDVMRVLDVRGAAVVGIERGINLPLAGRAEGGGAGGESIVLEVRASKSRPDRGFVRFRHEVTNGRGEMVMLAENPIMLSRRPG